MAAFTAAMKAFLSNVPGCWASIVSALAALACDPTSPAGGSAASWASLAFAAAGGCARFSRAVALTLPVTAVKAGSSSGRTPVGRTGGCSSASAANGAGAAPIAAAFVEALGTAPSAAGFAPALACAIRGSGLGRSPAERTDRRHLLRRGHRLLRGHGPGPKPVVFTASAEAGGRTPSRSTGTPAAFAALRPFSTVSTAGSSRRSSRSAPSMSATAWSPGNRIRPAIKALTAAFPAARCSASAAHRPGRKRSAMSHEPGAGRWSARR